MLEEVSGNDDWNISTRFWLWLELDKRDEGDSIARDSTESAVTLDGLNETPVMLDGVNETCRMFARPTRSSGRDLESFAPIILEIKNVQEAVPNLKYIRDDRDSLVSLVRWSVLCKSCGRHS